MKTDIKQEPTGLTLEESFNLYGWPINEETEEDRIKQAVKEFLKEGGKL